MKRIFILILLVSASLNCSFFHQNAFTLKMKNAPVGTQVFLDGVQKGNIQADGTLVLKGIEPGIHSLSLKLKDYPDYNQIINGQVGEVVEVVPMLNKQ